MGSAKRYVDTSGGKPCPGCGAMIDRHTALSPPKVGDVMLCAHCAGVAVYTLGGEWRVPEGEERARILALPQVARAIEGILEGMPADRAAEYANRRPS